jgi:hypothetical protein
MEITGIVEKVSEQQSPEGSPRKWSKKSFLVNGEWLGTFISKENKAQLNAPQEGDAVKVTYEVKGNFKNLTAIEVVAKSNDEPVVGKQSYANPVPYNVQDKDYRITFLASRRDAVEFINNAISHGMISLGTKKSDQLDNFYAYVNEYAHKFAEDAYIGRDQRGTSQVNTEIKKAASDVE